MFTGVLGGMTAGSSLPGKQAYTYKKFYAKMPSKI
jgi:hypothetical protein